MEWIIVVLIIAFFVYKMMPTKGVNQMTTTELKTVLSDKSKQFIDVRTPGEYKGRHISQFKNIPLDQLSKKLDQLDQSKEIVVICQSGMRSARAANMLKKAGFTQVTNVRGGMSAWS